MAATPSDYQELATQVNQLTTELAEVRRELAGDMAQSIWGYDMVRSRVSTTDLKVTRMAQTLDTTNQGLTAVQQGLDPILIAADQQL